MDKYVTRKSRPSQGQNSDSKKAKNDPDLFELVDSGRLLVYHPVSSSSVREKQVDGTAVKRKLATFDLDQTLITSKSGKKFPSMVDPTDWQWIYPKKIVSKLTSLHQQGFELIIFTNQAGIGADTTGAYLSAFKQKLRLIMDQLCEVPVVVYVALFKDVYRKPCPGMWDAWKARAGLAHEQDEIDWTNSFFVGDAAGRQTGWSTETAKSPADFADTDRKFALNIGLSFFTPEEFFMGHEKIELPVLRFHPKTLFSSPSTFASESASASTSHEDDSLVSFPKEQEVILLVGCPGSGKTTFYETMLAPKGYHAINQDTLKTRKACLAKAASLIEAGHSIAIDCTNPSKYARADYVQLAKSHRLPIRCFILCSSYELAYHLNMYRSLTEANYPSIPMVAYEKYKRDFEKPQLAEGFSAIVEIDFQLKKTMLKNERLFYSILY